MFFLLSKVLGFFAVPSNLMVALGVAGLLLTRTRLRRAGWRLVASSVLLIAAFGILPFGKALILPLEDRFPPWRASGEAPAGIVVLGGAIDPQNVATRGTADLNEAAERLTAVAGLARDFPSARIVYSGGDAGLVLRSGSEAEYAVGLLESFGIARSRIVLEDKSRNTYENAVYSKMVAAPKPGERWLLVTSAYHMPRSIGVFREVGFTVEAYPVDWRTGGIADLMIPFDAVGSGLRRTDTAMHEWVGLVAYWLTGKSAALFPAP